MTSNKYIKETRVSVHPIDTLNVDSFPDGLFFELQNNSGLKFEGASDSRFTKPSNINAFFDRAILKNIHGFKDTRIVGNRLIVNTKDHKTFKVQLNILVSDESKLNFVISGDVPLVAILESFFSKGLKLVTMHYPTPRNGKDMTILVNKL